MSGICFKPIFGGRGSGDLATAQYCGSAGGCVRPVGLSPFHGGGCLEFSVMKTYAGVSQIYFDHRAVSLHRASLWAPRL